ncbi:conserved membrane hypothetical protein [Alphaproteobacteria bacterium]
MNLYGTKKSSSIVSYFILFLCLLGLLYVLQFSTYLCLVMLVWLLPTIVAIVVDTHPKLYFSVVVCMLNACGIMPYVLQMVMNYGDIDIAALQFLQNNSILLYIYSYASVGWLVYVIVPKLAEITIKARIERKMLNLELELEKLKTKWRI